MRARPARRVVGGARWHNSSRFGWAAVAIGVALLATSCQKAATAAPPRPQSGSASTTSAAPGTSTTRPKHPRTTKPAKTKTPSKTRPATWTLVTEPNEGMQPIYSLMSSARHELDMTMYELADPEAVDILESDAARGVRVRVILDKAYSGGDVNAGAYSALRSNGVQVHFAPAGTIFHQKTITVDDHTSAIMTLNLTSEYYASTRDFAVLTTDRADVKAIEQVFEADWSDAGPPETGPPGASLVWSPGAEGSLLAVIGSAQHSLLVENEEMDEPQIVDALEAAARDGLRVEVVMTDSPSWAGAFGGLVAAGVKVSTYSSDASLYIHAKVIVADGTTAFVGSQNFSVSSLDYNRELGIIIRNGAIVRSLARTLEADFSGATPFTSGGGGPPTTSQPPGTTTPAAGASCQASASPANDGHSGDYDVYVRSNQPHKKATASDPGDTYSYYTDASGYAVIYLWHTSPGETITVTVGGATCSTTA